MPRYLLGLVLLTCRRQAAGARRVIQQLVDGLGDPVGGVVLCGFLLRRSTLSLHLLLEAFLDDVELSV